MRNEEQQDNINMEIDALKEIPSGVGIFDVTDSVIEMKYLNDGFYRMIGDRRENRTRFFNKNTINSVHPDDRAGLLTEALSSIEEKRMFEYRFRNLNGSGAYIWIGIRASHRPLNAKTERFFASYYDVDSYVSEQNASAAYRSDLDSMLGSIPGGVAVFSAEGDTIRLEYTNAGFYKLHHGSREYWAGQSSNPVDWLTPDDRHLFLDEFNAVNTGEKEQGSIVYRIIGEDGELHFVCNQFRSAYQRDGVRYYYASFIDMDEQISAEQELLRDKQMYDDAAMSARLIIWTYDAATHRARMMKSGYTEKVCRELNVPEVLENVTDTLLPYIDADDRGKFVSAYHAIEEGAAISACDFRFKLPRQETPQYERMVLKRVLDRDGRLLTVYCCGQNITAQKQNEEKFDRAYEQIDNPNSYGSFHLNLSKNWCGNGAVGKSRIKSVLDLQKSGTVDGYFRDFAALIADDDVRSAFFKSFDRELLLSEFEKGTERISIEYPVVYENGERHWREGFLSMMKNPHTGDIEAVTYSFDIDGRKRDEFIMAKLIHDHFDYIAVIHPDTQTFEFRSKKPWITLGEPGEAIPYETCCAYVLSGFGSESERDAFDKIISLDVIQRDLRENGHRSVTYIRTVGEKVYCVRMQYTWLEKVGGDILVVRSDVTEAYMKEQQQMRVLEEEKQAAEAANIAKSAFLSRMSHDIRTPLNGIIGMTYLAREQQNSRRTEDCLTKIDTSSKFLLSLINDVLDMSKAESGKIELHPEPYPIDEFSAYIDAIIVPLCRERGQTFAFEPLSVLHGICPLMDKLRINQIVFNLLSNAVKYTPEGGSITFRTTETPLAGNRMAMHIEIADDGIGMSENFQKILFDPFTQEKRDETSEMRGTGLGLAITKRLVDAMDGSISVKSTLGEGTIFSIDFDLACVPSDSGGTQKGTGPHSTGEADLFGKHILLCEDHPLNQEIAKAMLEEKQLVVELAGDGQAGVRAFVNSSISYFDCILMDIHMPIMDGYEAAGAIRALDRPDAKTVPIIAMTADAFSEDIQHCLDAGMNGHVAKPIDPVTLYGALLNAVKGKTGA